MKLYVKKLPISSEIQSNCIYINSHSNFIYFYKKITKLFELGHSCIILIGMGACLIKTIKLGLIYKKKHDKIINISFSTDTKELTDYIKIEADESNTEYYQKRLNSQIKVILKYKNL